MAPRESLLRWLKAAATRVRWQRALHDAMWAAAGLMVLAACHATVVAFAGAPAIVTAIRPLLLLVAFAIVAGFGVRRWPPADLAVVAAAADARAGLHDELLSAHWFATRADADPFVDRHVRHAVQIAGALDVARLFPLRVPGHAVAAGAVALLIAVAAHAWPRMRDATAPDLQEVAGASTRGVREETRSPIAGGDATADADDGRSRAAAALWKQLDALAGELSRRPGGPSLAQAVAARDARAAAQALRDAKQADAPQTAGGATAKPDEQTTSALAADILDRIAALMKAGDADGAARRPEAADPDRPTARLDRELRADQDDAQKSAPREQSAGEDALNTSLRALSRSSTGGRDNVHGEADSTEGAGRANVGGGAMGRRVNTSTAGAGEGDQPTGAATAPEGDQVLGRKTERLAVQLRTVRLPQGDDAARDDPDDPAGTEESFYAATRAQAARTAFASVGAVSRSTAEAAQAGATSPLEFRDAVKRYTLARHRREPVRPTGDLP
jgi:hypothetical protein